KVVSPQERALRHKNIYSKKPLLEVINVEKEYFSTVGFFQKKIAFKAVNRISFQLFEGETLGLVGESGCGKSTLGKAILQLDKATAGTIKYRGKDITQLHGDDLRLLRKEIQIIFQDPYSSLNPRIWIRSEEHTSELQSRENLVCRLLLEKKKITNINSI